MSTHTPIPWRYEEGTETIRAAPSNYWLASMDSWDGAVNHQANAEFIIKAVNNHDLMLAALKRAAPWLGRMIADGGHEECVLPKDCERALDMVETVIAKIEGGGGWRYEQASIPR